MYLRGNISTWSWFTPAPTHPAQSTRSSYPIFSLSFQFFVSFLGWARRSRDGLMELPYARVIVMDPPLPASYPVVGGQPSRRVSLGGGGSALHSHITGSRDVRIGGARPFRWRSVLVSDRHQIFCPTYSLDTIVEASVCDGEQDRAGCEHLEGVCIFRPSATKSGLPHGVTSALSLS